MQSSSGIFQVSESTGDVVGVAGYVERSGSGWPPQGALSHQRRTTKTSFPPRIRIAICAAVGLAFSGCGSSGGSSSSVTTPPATAMVTGTVARGAAVANAAVTITDVNGAKVTTKADANGNFTADVTGLTPPLLLVATDPTGTTTPLASVLTAAPAGSTSTVANITTLTTGVTALLSPTGNPFTLTGNLGSLVTAGTVSTAVSTLDTALSSILAANGLSSSSFNPISTPLVAGSSAVDAVVAAVSLVPQSSGSTGALQLVSTANPSTPLALSTATTAPSPLAAPPAAASSTYADFLQKELTNCLALPIVQRAAANACTAMVDAAFKHNGYTTLDTAYADFADPRSVGASVGLPQSVRFSTDASGNQLALVQLPYQLNDGSMGNIAIVLRSLSAPLTLGDGTVINWSIYGNQRKYDAFLRSFIARRQFRDTLPADVSRYEAGLNIVFNPSGPNASNVNVVQVTGPGLPSGGLFLARSKACGTITFMGISSLSSAPTTIPAGQTHTLVASNTALYRWDWQALSSTATFAPPVSGAWATTPVVASTIPLFATYTFTLYDTTGTQIDTFTTTNNAPPIAASYGQAVHWPTPQLNTLNVLNPAGSVAAAQSALTVDWLPDPLGLPVQSAAVFSGPTTTPSTTAEVDGFSAVPGSTFNATLQAGTSTDGSSSSVCTGSQFVPLATGNYRLVQFRSMEPTTIRQFDIYQYND
jgi:hypothetical protein